MYPKADCCDTTSRRLRSTRSRATKSTRPRVASSSAETARCVPSNARIHSILIKFTQIFRFSGSKTESLFQQRKNPRKIAWTVVYRRMHKKGLTEEVAKKRSRKTVKHQRGIVGADMASILAKRNQTAAARASQRAAAVTKAKTEKKDKEAKKPKVRRTPLSCIPILY